MDSTTKRKQLNIQIEETQDAESTFPENENGYSPVKQYKIWCQIAVYSLLVFIGQSVATLLGRMYYEKGGKIKYIAALVQSAGFPILLIPLLYIKSMIRGSPTLDHEYSPRRTLVLKATLYFTFGTLLAFDCMLYAVGLMYLPVSTFSLICASQLAFNALFSYFINSQRFTPFIVNSIFLLTVSTILLVLQPDSSGPTSDGKKFVIGFISTLFGAAGYALILSVEQFAYGKILKRQTIKEILEVIFFESMVTTFVLLIGLFGSGEWRYLKKEMEGFELSGKMYVMILLSSALAWQVFAIGMVALILMVSSLFANVITTLNVPIVPVLAVVFFKDEMSGMKIMAMLLAIWGFVSYVYQQYTDNIMSKEENIDDLPISHGNVSL